MSNLCWKHYPLVATHPGVRRWLTIQDNLGLARNTIEAYGRALDDYLHFSTSQGVEIEAATIEHVAAYVDYLAHCRRDRGRTVVQLSPRVGLANATMQQRLTAIRLYYDFLLEEGIRLDNPVGRGKYTPGRAFAGKRDRGLIPHYRTLPWIPNEDEWEAVLHSVAQESVRDRFMFGLAYDAALRREELGSLEVGDFDPSHRLIRIRAETTKNRQERSMPYSLTTSTLFFTYLHHRRDISRERGPLFRSESHRNHACPLSKWSWSKTVERIA